MDAWRYICLEGPDCVGKSTMAKRIQAWLAEIGIESIIAPQPGATALGQKLRQIIKHDDTINIGMETEAFVFVLDQMAFVEDLLVEAQKHGVWVISDRNNYISALVYQVLNGVDICRLDRFYSIVRSPKLDVTFLLQAPSSTLKNRIDRDSKRWDRYESNIAFMERVYDAYGNLMNDHRSRLSWISQRCVPINAAADEDAVFGQIEVELKKLLK